MVPRKTRFVPGRPAHLLIPGGDHSWQSVSCHAERVPDHGEWLLFLSASLPLIPLNSLEELKRHAVLGPGFPPAHRPWGHNFQGNDESEVEGRKQGAPTAWKLRAWLLSFQTPQLSKQVAPGPLCTGGGSCWHSLPHPQPLGIFCSQF